MTTMTCDDAFEALTGPTGFGAADVEAHLRACARCREMSEVLAPALALFAGDAPVEPACFDDRPVAAAAATERTGGVLLSTAAVRAADDAARDLAAHSRRRRNVALPGVLRIAAVFLLGIATAFGIAGLRSDGNPAVTESQNEGACLWVSTDTRSADKVDAEHVILSCVACHLPATGR